MTNVLFNRETLRVTGTGREPLPFEIEIKNVDVSNLTKEVTYTEKMDKLNEEGKPLYLLPQEPLVEEIGEERLIETTEDTGNPVMTKVLKKVPLLNENNKQVKYEKKVVGETTDDTGNPVMILDEETGELVQKTDKNGNPLFYGLVGTGEFIKCYTTEEVEEQKKDKYGRPLFYDTEIVMVEKVTEQPPIEITEDDERFHEGLEKVQVEVEKTKTVKFEEDMSVFTHDGIVKAKEKQLLKGTFYTACKLFEQMDESIFSANISGFYADLGFDFLSLPSGGEARTIKLKLPNKAEVVGIKFESSDGGLEVLVGNTASNLIPIDRNNEVIFDEPVSEVYVKFENPTDKRIDVHSFALLV